MKFRKGFTLIELLVVIAIIGILASVVLASLNSARVGARNTKRQADMRSVALALELYFDSFSSYPSTTTDLVTADLLPQWPVDPLSTNTQYSYTATGTAYVLRATLEDDTDIDGDVDGTDVLGTGVDCTDANGHYCLTP